ncbi:MAG: tetratricopeptide repeat protein [Gemmatimonadota bacterium]|nr:MAG: tetratricopeptide repeat protein [Gemmatimonadota bacterium]
MNLGYIENRHQFEALVQRLFEVDSRDRDSQFRGFRVVSAEMGGGDHGMDGFLPDGRVFQIYYSLGRAKTPIEVREQRKIRRTCKKIARLRQQVETTIGHPLAGLVFVLARHPDDSLYEYCRRTGDDLLPGVEVDILGADTVSNLLVKHWQAVRDLIPFAAVPDTDNIRKMLKAATQCLERGEAGFASDLASRVVEEALLAGDEALRLEGLCELGAASLQLGELESFASAVRDAWKCAVDTGADSRLRAMALRLVAELKLRAGRPRAAHAIGHRALRLSREANDRGGTAWSQCRLAWSALALGDIADAGLHAETWYEYRCHGDVVGEAAHKEVSSEIAFRLGNISEAANLMAAAAVLFHKANHRQAECTTTRRHAEMLASGGRLDEAIAVCRALATPSARHASSPESLSVELLLAELLLAQHRDDSVVSLCDSIRARAEAAGEPSISGRALLVLATIHFRASRYGRATDGAAAAYEAFATASLRSGQCEALQLLAVSRRAAGELLEAESAFRRLVALAEQPVGPLASAARHDLAALLAEVGQYDEALEVLSVFPSASSPMDGDLPRQAESNFGGEPESIRQFRDRILADGRVRPMILLEGLTLLLFEQHGVPTAAEPVSAPPRRMTPPPAVQPPEDIMTAIAQLRCAIESQRAARHALLSIVRVSEPLQAAGTSEAPNLWEANKRVLEMALSWSAAYPKAAAPILDFWGRGNFVRLALNHQHFRRGLKVTVEVSSVGQARQAIRCLALLADCLILIWKGELECKTVLFDAHVDYSGPGGWGYYVFAGDKSRPHEEAPWDWCPVLGVGSYLPDAVARFYLEEARPLVADGRLLLLPAPLVGCVTANHSLLDRLLADVMSASAVLRKGEGRSRDELVSIAFPYFPDAPLEDLAKMIKDEHESLVQMRLALLRLLDEAGVTGTELSRRARLRLSEEVGHGIELVRTRFERLARRMTRSDQFVPRSSRLAAQAVPLTGSEAFTTADPAANALQQLAEGAGLRRDPWYAFWKMEEQFGGQWEIGGPLLPSAGPPSVENVRPDAQREARQFYHWLHPPESGWATPYVAR